MPEHLAPGGVGFDQIAVHADSSSVVVFSSGSQPIHAPGTRETSNWFTWDRGLALVTRNEIGFRCRDHPLRQRISFWRRFAIALGPRTGVAFGQKQPAAQVDASAFPVSIRVDATKIRGEMRPVWRYFGYDEPNYTYMKDGQKLLSQLRALSPENGLHSHPQSADFRRWSACSEMGLDGRLHRRRSGSAPLQLDDSRPHLRHLPGSGPAALCPDRLHARSALDPPQALPARVDAGRAEVAIDRLGLPTQGLQEMGRAGFPVGQSLRRAI